MALGDRTARRHETAASKAAGVDRSIYWTFQPGQRVMTVDGFPGTIKAVEDGPLMGTEAYVVVLTNGMGGGEYTVSQLTAMNEVTASEVHTAADDYPELGHILVDRPDPGLNTTASKTASEWDTEEWEGDNNAASWKADGSHQDCPNCNGLGYLTAWPWGTCKTCKGSRKAAEDGLDATASKTATAPEGGVECYHCLSHEHGTEQHDGRDDHVNWEDAAHWTPGGEHQDIEEHHGHGGMADFFGRPDEHGGYDEGAIWPPAGQRNHPEDPSLVGYGHDGDLYCKNCHGPEDESCEGVCGPIFRHDDSSGPMGDHCNHWGCGRQIQPPWHSATRQDYFNHYGSDDHYSHARHPGNTDEDNAPLPAHQGSKTAVSEPDPDDHNYEGDGTSDCATCKYPMNAHASEYGTCENCGSDDHGTHDHLECEHCGSDDHTSDDHEDEPREDDSWISHERRGFRVSHNGEHVGEYEDHESAVHAMLHAQHDSGVSGNVWNENGSPVDVEEHYKRWMPNLFGKEHPSKGAKPVDEHEPIDEFSSHAKVRRHLMFDHNQTRFDLNLYRDKGHPLHPGGNESFVPTPMEHDEMLQHHEDLHEPDHDSCPVDGEDCPWTRCGHTHKARDTSGLFDSNLFGDQKHRDSARELLDENETGPTKYSSKTAAVPNHERDVNDLTGNCAEGKHDDCEDYPDTTCLCQCHDHMGVPHPYRTEGDGQYAPEPFAGGAHPGAHWLDHEGDDEDGYCDDCRPDPACYHCLSFEHGTDEHQDEPGPDAARWRPQHNAAKTAADAHEDGNDTHYWATTPRGMKNHLRAEHGYQGDPEINSKEDGVEEHNRRHEDNPEHYCDSDGNGWEVDSAHSRDSRNIWDSLDESDDIHRDAAKYTVYQPNGVEIAEIAEPGVDEANHLTWDGCSPACKDTHEYSMFGQNDAVEKQAAFSYKKPCYWCGSEDHTTVEHVLPTTDSDIHKDCFDAWSNDEMLSHLEHGHGHLDFVSSEDHHGLSEVHRRLHDQHDEKAQRPETEQDKLLEVKKNERAEFFGGVEEMLGGSEHDEARKFMDGNETGPTKYSSKDGVGSHNCFYCGEPMVENEDGTSNHVGEDGGVDHGADAHHVPIVDREDDGDIKTDFLTDLLDGNEQGPTKYSSKDGHDAWGDPIKQPYDGHGAWDCNNYDCVEHPQSMYPQEGEPQGMPGWLLHDTAADRDQRHEIDKHFHETEGMGDAGWALDQQPDGPTKESSKQAVHDFEQADPWYQADHLRIDHRNPSLYTDNPEEMVAEHDRRHEDEGGEDHNLAAWEGTWPGDYPFHYQPPRPGEVGRDPKFTASRVAFDPWAILTTAAADSDFRFQVTASWADVRAKAKRIRSNDGVNVTLSSQGMVIGEVRGDHHVYETGLQRHPGRQAIAAWSCGCKWGAYHWGAADDFSRFAGRMCSHALALQYEVQSRGMFGRDVTTDSTAPYWVPRRVVVKYDIDADMNRRGPATKVSSTSDSSYTVGCMDCGWKGKHTGFMGTASCPRCQSLGKGSGTIGRWPDETTDIEDALEGHEELGEKLDEGDQGPSKWSSLSVAATLIRYALRQGDDIGEITLALFTSGMSLPVIQAAANDAWGEPSPPPKKNIPGPTKAKDPDENPVSAGWASSPDPSAWSQAAPSGISDITSSKEYYPASWFPKGPECEEDPNNDSWCTHHEEYHDSGTEPAEALFTDEERKQQEWLLDQKGEGPTKESSLDESIFEPEVAKEALAIAPILRAVAPVVRAVAPTVIKAVAPTVIDKVLSPKKDTDEGTEAELHDEPEGALPSTDGAGDDEDDSWMSGPDADHQSPDPEPVGSKRPCFDCGDRGYDADLGDECQTCGGISLNGSTENVVANFQATAGAQMLLAGGGGAGGGEDGLDIAGAAKEHLAKVALKAFTPAEQYQIINEGEGTKAANLDRLDLTATHYLALEKALAAADDEDDDESWMTT